MDIPAILVKIRPGASWHLDGDDYSGLTWTDDTPKPTPEEIAAAWPEVKNAVDLADIRRERDALLAASDWTQIADAPVDAGKWAKYRQALRDLPAKTDDPANPKWPKAPQ